MFRTAFAATVIAAVAVSIVRPADAQPRRIQVGTLTCSLSAGVGLIVRSQRNVRCQFKGQPGEPEETYTGTMTRVGLDVGVTTGGAMIWAVFSDTNRYAGMLTGTYTGASAEVSVAAGLGANVLVGVYEISDGDRLIGKKTVRQPATGPVVKITYQLGDQTFDNPDAFMTAYLKAQAENA